MMIALWSFNAVAFLVNLRVVCLSVLGIVYKLQRPFLHIFKYINWQTTFVINYKLMTTVLTSFDSHLYLHTNFSI